MREKGLRERKRKREREEGKGKEGKWDGCVPSSLISTLLEGKNHLSCFSDSGFGFHCYAIILNPSPEFSLGCENFNLSLGFHCIVRTFIMLCEF